MENKYMKEGGMDWEEEKNKKDVAGWNWWIFLPKEREEKFKEWNEAVLGMDIVEWGHLQR